MGLWRRLLAVPDDLFFFLWLRELVSIHTTAEQIRRRKTFIRFKLFCGRIYQHVFNSNVSNRVQVPAGSPDRGPDLPNRYRPHHVQLARVLSIGDNTLPRPRRLYHDRSDGKRTSISSSLFLTRHTCLLMSLMAVPFYRPRNQLLSWSYLWLGLAYD
jgi:hypothetical protein